MGFNYWGTDSIATQSYDFSFSKSRAYKHDFGNNSYNFNFGGKTMGYSFSNSTSGSYSSNPVSVGYSFNFGNSSDLANYQTAINASLANVRTLSSLKNDENLSSESKSQIEEILKTAKKIEKQAREHSTSVIVLDAMAKWAAGLDAEAAELFATCQEEIVSALENKGDGNANADATATGNAGTATTGNDAAASSSAAVVEGDSKLDNGALSQRYGVKNPVTENLYSSVADNVITNAGKRNPFVTALSQISENNVIAFLVYLRENGKIASFTDAIDGQNGWFDNDDERSIRDFLFKFEGAFRKLKEAGYLTEEQCETYIANINSHNEKFRHHFEDDDRKALNNYLNTIAEELTVYANGKGVAIGTQEHFDMLIKEKQDAEAKKATQEFAKAYTEATGNEYDEKQIYVLPEGIKYLPNKKVFQVKLEDKIFEGKDFKELNSKIMKCKNEKRILAWSEMKKQIKPGQLVTLGVQLGEEVAKQIGVNPFAAVA